MQSINRDYREIGYEAPLTLILRVQQLFRNTIAFAILQ